MSELIITRFRDKICTAQTEDGRVVQFTFEDESDASILNHIYIGKVQKLVPGISAAFIDIGIAVGYYSLVENREHLFASKNHQGDLRPGDEIVVQVSRDAVKTKAPVLTSNLSFAGRTCVLTAGKKGVRFSSKLTDKEFRQRVSERLRRADEEGFGVIVRTNASEVTEDAVLEEYETLKQQFYRLMEESTCRTCFSCLYRSVPSYLASIRDSRAGKLEKIVTDVPEFFEEMKAYLRENQTEYESILSFYEDKLLPLPKLYRLESALEKALDKTVWLKSGGYLVIEPTEAMVVIDVNTGKYEGKKKLEETIRNINFEAAEEIARQLRLRNLSGIIMVDFIDMVKENDRKALLKHLETAVSKDPVKTVVVEMTRLNLVEMTRKKIRKPLYEQIRNE